MARWARRYCVAAVEDVIKQYISTGKIAHLQNRSNGTEIYLIGTSHVSAKSAAEVKEVIGLVKPDIVAVEMCEERAKRMLAGRNPVGLFEKLQAFMDIPGGLSEKVLRFALSSFQQAMSEAGLQPGQEFKVAMEEAKAAGAGILLIDQSIEATFSKLVNAIRLWDCISMIFWMEKSTYYTNNRRKMARNLINVMDTNFPSITRVLVHERDEYMTRQLLTKCQGKVVGVVGMGHMDGIEKRWQKEAQ